MGYGPINLLPMPLHSQLIVLEAFLASSVLVGFPVAAVLSTRERLTEEIINSRKHLALLASRRGANRRGYGWGSDLRASQHSRLGT